MGLVLVYLTAGFDFKDSQGGVIQLIPIAILSYYTIWHELMPSTAAACSGHVWSRFMLLLLPICYQFKRLKLLH
jgi:hypothetical protein